MQRYESHRAERRIAIGCCLAAFAAGGSVANAQSTGGASGQAAESLDEIIVTAQRRAERLEDVPAAILAIDGESLRAAQVTRFQDLQIVAPALQVGRTGILNQPAIRGVTTSFSGGGQETNVAVYVDGFYNADQLSINQDFANIESVEVLKGPQGTLYGRNATGGAILITTRSPGDKFETDVTLGLAPRFDDRKAEAFVGGPLTERVKLGVAGYFRKNDGYFRDINDFAPSAPIRSTNPGKRTGDNSAPFENWSVRPKLVLDATENVKLTLGYVHSFLNDSRSLAYRVIDHIPGAPVTYNGYPLATERDTTSLNFQPVNETEVDEYQLTAELGIGVGTITTRTMWRQQDNYQIYDLDATPRDPASGPGYSQNGENYIDRDTFIQQVDFSSGFDGPFSLLTGLFYYDDKYEGESYDDSGAVSPLNPTLTSLDFKTEAWAAYIDGTYNIGNLYITAGARYSEDRKEVFSERVDSAGALVTTSNSLYYSPATDGVIKHKSDALTPRVVARYNLSPGSNVYASISRGFKSATISSTAPYNTLEPEKVTAYEIGFKSSQSRLRTDVSVFYYDFKHNQIAALDPTRPNLTSLLQNSGGARNYGIDGTLAYQVTESFHARLALAYLHARYTDFDNATNTVVDPATNLNTSVIGSWSGRRIIRSPDWSGSLAADYTANFAGGKLVFGGTMTFSSRYATSNASYQCDYSLQGGINRCNPGTNNTRRGRFEENGYTLFNGQVAWTDPSDRFTLTGFVTNITNERFKTSTVGLYFGDYISFNEPRVVGASLRYRY